MGERQDDKQAATHGDVAPGGVISVRTIGYPEVTSDGRPVRLRYRKSEALLYYLAIENRPASRTFLTELLWPDLDARAGARNLRGVLTDLRAVLGPRLQAEPSAGSIAVLQIRCDRHRLQAPRDLGTRSELSLQDAESLLGNQALLEGFELPDAEAFELWRAEASERFRDERHAMRFTMADLALQNDQTDLAISLLEASLAHEPWNELVARRLAILQLQWRSPTRALSVLDGMTRALMNELGERPDRSTQRLRTIIQASSTRSARSALSFHGRHHEVETLSQALLHPTSRIVTLRAPPGMGSTRVLQTAQDAARLEADHAFVWVDANPSEPVADVEARLDEALHAGSGSEGSETRGRTLRVILDGLAAHPDLGSLVEHVAARPDVAVVIVHAWRPLDLPGESCVTMHGLRTPAISTTRPADVLSTPAARLLADAYDAQEKPPGTTHVTDHPDFAAWVRASQGNPRLLLTLARYLAEFGIEGRSPHDDAVTSFVAAEHGAIPFLANVDPERLMLATAVALHRNGASATTLAHMTGEEVDATAKRLEELTERGLTYRTGETRDVHRTESGLAPALWYTARNDPRLAAWRRHQATAWLQRLEPLAAPNLGSDERQLMTDVMDQLDDIDASIAFLEQDDPLKAIRLATLASGLNRSVRRPDKVRRQLTPLLEQHEADLTPQHRVEALNALAMAHAFSDELASASSVQERALAEADDIGDPFLQAQTRLNLGYVRVLEESLTAATTLFIEARDIARAADLPWLLGGSLINLGHALKDQRAYEEAVVAYTEGIETMQRTGDGVGQAAGNIGLLSALAALGDTAALSTAIHALNQKLTRLPTNLGHPLSPSLERALDSLAHFGLSGAFEHLERIVRQRSLTRN